MKPKMTSAPARKAVHGPRQNTWGREGLEEYLTAPESWPASVVVYYDDKWVVINDKYPKADIHLLILPRDPKKSTLVPQDAFEDPIFLEECRQEEKKVRHMVAEQLRRRYGQFSTEEQARIAAMRSDDPPDKLPPGRDWNQMIISGVHARPSMKHLHIHVLSRDMVSSALKTRDHYLSFTTDFLIGLEDFPLDHSDRRRPQGRPPVHREFAIVSLDLRVSAFCPAITIAVLASNAENRFHHVRIR